MTTWIIEPRDPLIVRDGRPFGPTPGARAASLGFPFPSTTTGGLRTRAGLDVKGVFDQKNIPTVKNIQVRGPLLVEIDTDERIKDWLCTPPSDALLFNVSGQDKKQAILKRLVPMKISAEILTDLDLEMIGLIKSESKKPLSDPPRFWYWGKLLEWLAEPADKYPEGKVTLLKELGHKGPEREVRTHVSIEVETQASREGALFQTRGLEFSAAEYNQDGTVKSYRRFALAVAVDDLRGLSLANGLAALGGERRLVAWRESKESNLDIFSQPCPKAIRDEIKKSGKCRIILLTPARFINGSRPEQNWLYHEGVTPELKALAVARAQVVSGWDFEINEPKPTRRLAPAGTIFFLDLKTSDEKLIDAWIDATWMKCVSDKPQDCFDGFGLAALGAWDGENT